VLRVVSATAAECLPRGLSAAMIGDRMCAG
jgi:hypothetical protein